MVTDLHREDGCSELHLCLNLDFHFFQLCFWLLCLRWSAPPDKWRWRWIHKDPPQSGHISSPSPAGKNKEGRGRRAQSPGPHPPQTAPLAETSGPYGQWLMRGDGVSLSVLLTCTRVCRKNCRWWFNGINLDRDEQRRGYCKTKNASISILCCREPT